MATKTKKTNFRLDPEWIFAEPIDFEHKKYTLLAYLQKCDKRFDELKIYPDFVELSLHLANLQSIDKENTMLIIKKRLTSPDDEILFKDLVPKKPPVLDENELEEIKKTVKFSGQKIYEAFSVAKSIWNVAHDSISVHLKKNKDFLEGGVGYLFYRKKIDDTIYVWEYEIKKDSDEDYNSKTFLSLIHSGGTDEKTFTEIIENNSKWKDLEHFKSFPVFEVKCSQEFPFEETFLPMVKRALMSYVFQVVNFRKMKNLEE